jgi:hypothetical protein
MADASPEKSGQVIPPESNPGAATDAHGLPVVDPTRNVLQLVEAAIQRQDDLRDADARHVREVAALRDRYEDRLREAESVRVKERLETIAHELKQRESQRIELKADAEKNIAAALQAAKEAVQEQTTAFAVATAKSEAATTKSIEQLGATFTTAFDGFRRELGDLKDRVINMETQKVSSTDVAETQAETRRALQELTEKLGKLGA